MYVKMITCSESIQSFQTSQSFLGNPVFLDERYLNISILRWRICKQHRCTNEQRAQQHGVVEQGLYLNVLCNSKFTKSTQLWERSNWCCILCPKARILRVNVPYVERTSETYKLFTVVRCRVLGKHFFWRVRFAGA